MKKLKGIFLVMKVACTALIWCFAVYAMFFVFKEKSEPLYGQSMINEIPDGNLFLYPQDVLRQTFEIKTDNLQNVALAFDYDDAVMETGTLLVRFYYNDAIVVEQPLPFFACYQKSFIEFGLDLPGGSLTIEVKNTSENADCVLSVLDTSNYYAYHDYSEGYRLNDDAIVQSSILCCFKYIKGYEYYKGLSYAFLVFLAAIILENLLRKGFAWLQQRICC